MTYIEFFDREAAENITACLTYAPDRVIYIGNNGKLMKKHIERYKRLFADRGISIDFSCRTISRYNLDDAVALLSELVETYDDCVFDITGGEEILTVALGVVFGRYPEKKIQIHKLNLRNNAVYDCDKDGTTICRETPTLSIDENIRIYGGDVVYGGLSSGSTVQWELTEDFVEDVHRIWEVCRENVRDWNVQCGLLEVAEKVGTVSEDGLTVVCSAAALEQHSSRGRLSSKASNRILSQLVRQGILTHYDEDDGLFAISYKNRQVKKCLTKSGQALEMKIFVTAKFLQDPNGERVYDDALTGVLIDWDGEFHEESVEGVYDTENEVDVMLMHDVVPVFISCKNGHVSADELYKLNTVAERFGGQYSKKVLVATALERLGETAEYLRQRAADMNIRLLENVDEWDHAALEKKLLTLWNT